MYHYTAYFEKKILRKRPYLRKEYCIRVIEHPLKSEAQGKGRYRFWGRIKELGNRVLRVVTLADKKTIHNAFLDRGYRP